MERILPETIPPIDSPIETPVPDATVYPTASQVAGAAPRAPPWPWWSMPWWAVHIENEGVTLFTLW